MVEADKPQVAEDISGVAATLGLRISPDPGDPHGESEVSAEASAEVSSDETDILDEGSQATGFIGKSSEVRWLRRLQQDAKSREETPSGPDGSNNSEAAKRRTEVKAQREQQKPDIPTKSSTFYLDGDGIEVDYSVERYELPTIEVAQRLLDRYMWTVQDTFPIVSRQTFTDQVRQYYVSIMQGAPFHVPERWLATLNLVFAIGARYSHLTGADWQADSRDHIIYQSRAHMLNLDEPSLLFQPDLMRVQVNALFAFYSSSVGNVNR